MAQATENSELLCNSSLKGIDSNQPSYRDFKGAEQFKFDKAQLVPNDPEYKNFLSSSLLPSASSPTSLACVHRLNSPHSKNYKVWGSSKKELEQVMNKYLKFKGFINSQDLSGKLEEGGYLVSKDINSAVWCHAIGVMVLLNGREYFDSTGNKPTHFNSDFEYIAINSVKLQHDNNMTCGPHSCFYLSKRLEDNSMDDIIKQYPSQNGGTLEENDNFVNEYFNSACVKSMKIVKE